jgi:hypothetical protein
LAFAAFIAPDAPAQDVFSSGANPGSNANTGKTGTQGVNGNPFCPPPVIIIEGVATTPRNWSCRGDSESYKIPPYTPPAAAHPRTVAPYDPSYERLPQNVPRPPPTPYGRTDPNPESRGQTPNYRKPPMPPGMISPGYDEPVQCYRMDKMPPGMISPGYDEPVQCYRIDKMPPGIISPGYDEPVQCYRVDDSMPLGVLSTGHGTTIQCYRQRSKPEVRTSPGLDFSIQINR